MRNKTGFTVVELLTAVAVIAILLGILMPALNLAQDKANEVKQRAQIISIETGLELFKNDMGQYPDSNQSPDEDYCGSHKMTEALVGWDLLGFHPDSKFQADGKWGIGALEQYDTGSMTDAERQQNLDMRKPLYVDTDKMGVFRVEDFNKPGYPHTTPLKDPGQKCYLLCDVYSFTKCSRGNLTLKMGTPILYYRANKSSVIFDTNRWDISRYNPGDNEILLALGCAKKPKLSWNKDAHPMFDSSGEYKFFLEYIKDPRITTHDWPSKPDTFLLISAGKDGQYGTKDDICNFTPNVIAAQEFK